MPFVTNEEAKSSVQDRAAPVKEPGRMARALDDVARFGENACRLAAGVRVPIGYPAKILAHLRGREATRNTH